MGVPISEPAEVSLFIPRKELPLLLGGVRVVGDGSRLAILVIGSGSGPVSPSWPHSHTYLRRQCIVCNGKSVLAF